MAFGPPVPLPIAEVCNALGFGQHLYLAFAQLGLGLFPFDGMTDGAEQHIAVKPRLDEIVLRAHTHNLPGGRLIIERGDDHDGDVRHTGMDLAESVESLAIGQGKIQQDEIIVLFFR